MPVWRCALVSVLCQTGQEAQLRRDFEWLARGGFERIKRDNAWMVSLALLAEACAELGDADRAAELYAMLEPYAGRNVVPPDTAFVDPVARFLGVLAATRKEWDAARAHFEAAREAARGLGARPTLVRTDIDEARMLLARDGEADRRAADELLSRAHALAGELGLTRIQERIELLRGGAPAPPPERAPEPVGSRSLVREGDYWKLAFGASSVMLRDSKGMGYLARLLGQPGVEVHALDLVTVSEGGGAAPGPEPELSVRAGGEEDAGPLLDETAKRQYRERLEELRGELEEAESFNDPERARRTQEEMDALLERAAARSRGRADFELVH
jgi:hypothetical protein